MSESSADVRDLPAPAIRWLMRILALAALGVTSYLFATGLTRAPAPLGCGPGSGCDQLLSGTWSDIVGIPVSGLAIVVYAVLLLATAALEPRVVPSRRRVAWIAALLLGAMASGSAIWFIFIQSFVVGEFCPWCMAVHTCGLLLTALLLIFAPVRTANPAPEIASPLAAPGADSSRMAAQFTPVTMGGALVVGVLTVAILAAGQWFTQEPGFRVVSVEGIQFPAHDFPRIGRLDNDPIVLLFTDYACPHCRRAHGDLEQARRTFGDALTVVVIPAPLHVACNPTHGDDSPQLAAGCDLARLALAVWMADRDSFARFDQWLMGGQAPRDPLDADRFAQQLVGTARLEQALANPIIDQQIEGGIAVNHRLRRGITEAGQPVGPGVPTMLIGQVAVAGAPDNAEALIDLLRGAGVGR
ncbi:MAG: hypothetical protein JJU36_02380 [Phycisphaeraceae bacterium]|nr:hypothetical protein [Phycisphaeraceae bacterium]